MIAKIKLYNESNQLVEVDMEYEQEVFDSYLKDKDGNQVLFLTDEDYKNELWKCVNTIPENILKDNEKIILKDETYYISTLGRVLVSKKYENKYVLKGFRLRLGGRSNSSQKEIIYRSVRINGKDIDIHRLVAYLYCSNDNPLIKTWNDHISTNTYDNSVNNIHWIHPTENSLNKSLSFDTSTCAHEYVPPVNPNTTRNKEPKVKLSLDGLQVIKIYKDVKELALDYTAKERDRISRCCNQNQKENTNSHNALQFKWMFYSHYVKYYSDTSNQITHVTKISTPDRFKTENIFIEDIVKLKVEDINNIGYTYKQNYTQEELDNEKWFLCTIPEDCAFISDKNKEIMSRNIKVKRYFISNLGRIVSFIGNKLILKGITKGGVTLFNIIFNVSKLYKANFNEKGEKI